MYPTSMQVNLIIYYITSGICSSNPVFRIFLMNMFTVEKTKIKQKEAI